MSSLAKFEFESHEVRTVLIENEPWFVASDVAKVLEHSNTTKMLSLVDEDDKKIINPQELDSAEASFNKNTFRLSLINKSGLYNVIANTTKIGSERKNTLFLSWTGSDIKHFIKKNRIENTTIDIIFDSFCHLSPVKQFYISGYRIDLYFPKERIAIECDENSHSGYNYDKELLRQDVITKLLGCQFIRFNPNSRSFKLGKVINELIQAIYLSK